MVLIAGCSERQLEQWDARLAKLEEQRQELLAYKQVAIDALAAAQAVAEASGSESAQENLAAAQAKLDETTAVVEELETVIADLRGNIADAQAGREAGWSDLQISLTAIGGGLSSLLAAWQAHRMGKRSGQREGYKQGLYDPVPHAPPLRTPEGV